MSCVWEFDPACLGDKWFALDPDVQDRALLLATSSLLALTNNRVGTCPITIRPCRTKASCGCGWSPTLWEGSWYNSCPCSTQCAPLSEYAIPGPVGYIYSLKVDGVEQDLSGSDWRLDNGHILVWQGDGDSPLPYTQDLNKPDTEVGTWSLTYSKSYPVGEDAKLAVAYLAMEFAQACAPKGKCSLPRGVTSVVRNGVSFSIEAGLFPNGFTGLDIVDQFILKWAPTGGPKRSAQVFNPRGGATPRVASTIHIRAK